MKAVTWHGERRRAGRLRQALRLSALHFAIEIVRRGGTISLIGVYGCATDSPRMPTLFDDFATHKLPLEQAPDAYRMFQQEQDGAVKVLLTP